MILHATFRTIVFRWKQGNSRRLVGNAGPHGDTQTVTLVPTVQFLGSLMCRCLDSEKQPRLRERTRKHHTHWHHGWESNQQPSLWGHSALLSPSKRRKENLFVQISRVPQNSRVGFQIKLCPKRFLSELLFLGEFCSEVVKWNAST